MPEILMRGNHNPDDTPAGVRENTRRQLGMLASSAALSLLALGATPSPKPLATFDDENPRKNSPLGEINKNRRDAGFGRYGNIQGPMETPEQAKMRSIEEWEARMTDAADQNDLQTAAQAAQELYRLTKKPEYMTQATDFLNNFAAQEKDREAKWYESYDKPFRTALQAYSHAKQLEDARAATSRDKARIKKEYENKRNEIYRIAGDLYLDHKYHWKAKEWFSKLPSPEKEQRIISVFKWGVEDALALNDTTLAKHVWGQVKKELEKYEEAAGKVSTVDGTFVRSVQSWLADMGGSDGTGGKIGRAVAEIEEGRRTARRSGADAFERARGGFGAAWAVVKEKLGIGGGSGATGGTSGSSGGGAPPGREILEGLRKLLTGH